MSACCDLHTDTCGEVDICCNNCPGEAEVKFFPIVDTVQALEALPPGSKLVGAGGVVYQRSVADDRWWCCDVDDIWRPSVTVVRHAQPLRVIWSPDALAVHDGAKPTEETA